MNLRSKSNSRTRALLRAIEGDVDGLRHVFLLGADFEVDDAGVLGLHEGVGVISAVCMGVHARPAFFSSLRNRLSRSLGTVNTSCLPRRFCSNTLRLARSSKSVRAVWYTT